MCGIFGYFAYSHQEWSLAGLDSYVDLMAHRGPDGRGVYQDRNAALGHRRLAIIDPSDKASQPMGSPDRWEWLTYNGELYNFLELRGELAAKGHVFTSISDTEVLLHAYREWGVEAIHRLQGIFAFALWDSRQQQLWLARDHLGVKPLYYADFQGVCYFASEIPPLLAIPHLPKDPDPHGVDAFLTFSYIPAPRTGYRHIRQLLPGNDLVVARNRIRPCREYWNIPLAPPSDPVPPAAAEERFTEIFSRVVRRQMISDVPVGVFLSGGTDSFAVAYAMKRWSTAAFSAFSIGFAEASYDELPQTRLSAAALDIPLIAERIGMEDSDLFAAVLPHCQDPFADSSSLAVYLLSRIAARHVKVVLGGDGADELLGGYRLYRANRYARIYRAIPRLIRQGLINPLVRLVPDRGGKYTWREQARRFLYGAEQKKWYDHASWRVIVPQEWKREVYTDSFYREVKDSDPREEYVGHMLQAKQAGASDLSAWLYGDMKFYLPNDMLVKVDRMSMAHGLEVRVPFLDTELVTFCFQLSDAMKIRGGIHKYILRRAIDSIYPERLKKMPKSGFNINPSFPLPLPADKESDGSYIRSAPAPHPFASRYSNFIYRFALAVLADTSCRYPEDFLL